MTSTYKLLQMLPDARAAGREASILDEIGVDGAYVRRHVEWGFASLSNSFTDRSGVDLTIENLLAAQREIMDRVAPAYGMRESLLRPLVPRMSGKEQARRTLELIQRYTTDGNGGGITIVTGAHLGDV